MCKVVKYRYTCGHSLMHRKSSCGGTKSKETRNSKKAACCAEPYITVKFSLDCSKCQQEVRIAQWKAKLERAKAFHDKLIRNNLPGAMEISTCMAELEDEYSIALWNLGKIFPQPHKQAINRVKPVDEEALRLRRQFSLLGQEVHRHDVVLPGEIAHLRKEEEEDDDETCLSTDPLHPISTNYVHLMDKGDDSWILSHFTEEDLQTPDEDAVGFDVAASGWDWGGQIDDTDAPIPIEPQNLESANANEPWKPTVWDPHADTNVSIGTLGIDALKIQDESHQATVDETVQAFWSIVNTDNEHFESSHKSSTERKRPLETCSTQHSG